MSNVHEQFTQRSGLIYQDIPSGGVFELNVWRETPFFTEKERAALAWTEAVTQVSSSHVREEVDEVARQWFDKNGTR